MVVQLQ